MVEKLEAYRAELEAQKTAVLATNVAPIIEERVEAYREQVIAELRLELDAQINKITSDIACLTAIIDREKAIAATAEEAVVEDQTAMNVAQ